MGLFDKLKKKTVEEPEVVLESWSPVCDIQAFVEKSATCYYLYLWMKPSSPSPQLKSCWICNRVAAPDELDVKAMESGNAPLMPKEFVAHPLEGMELEIDKLSVVWFEEGDAVALLSDMDVICVIPGWGGCNGFHGYSIYANGPGPYAWEMVGAKETLTARTKKSNSFWDFFEHDYWSDVQKMHMDALEEFFGVHEKYFAIDGGKFPPKALILGTRESTSYAVTAGVSLIPMPVVEQYFQEETNHNRRIELGFAATVEHKSLCEHMGGAISNIAMIPWREITFLAHGHTVPYRNINGFEALLFLNPKEVPGLEMPIYDRFMGDDINLLWIVPITQEEYEFVMENGVSELLTKSENKSRLHIFDGNNKFSRSIE